MKYAYFLIAIIISFYSCRDEQKESELTAKIEELEKQLDECQNGESRLLERLKQSSKDQDDESVVSIYRELLMRFPGSKSLEESKQYFENSEGRIKKRRADDEAEKIAELEAKKKSLSKLKKKLDDVSGITWYHQKYFTHYNNLNRTSIYMGKKEGSSPWLRLMMSYKGDDWIFFKKAMLSFEGNTREFPFNDYKEKESDHDGGEVWEWIDIQLSTDDIAWIKRFAKSPEAKMRLSGKYTETRNLTSQERQGITDVIAGYEFLSEK